jgi:hypothetical protein
VIFVSCLRAASRLFVGARGTGGVLGFLVERVSGVLWANFEKSAFDHRRAVFIRVEGVAVDERSRRRPHTPALGLPSRHRRESWGRGGGGDF